MGNSSYAEKTSDTVGRGDAAGCTITLTGVGAAGVDVLNNNHTIIEGTATGVYTLQCVFDVEEPFLHYQPLN